EVNDALEGEPIRFEVARRDTYLYVNVIATGATDASDEEDEDEDEDDEDEDEEPLRCGEWWRHEDVAIELNGALEKAGASRRIYMLPSAESTTAFLVVTPSVAEQLQRANVPVSLARYAWDRA